MVTIFQNKKIKIKTCSDEKNKQEYKLNMFLK
jgi:hypothetical protein